MAPADGIEVTCDCPNPLGHNDRRPGDPGYVPQFVCEHVAAALAAAAPPEEVRVIRVLEYVGEREWVEDTLARNAVKGSWSCTRGMIREAVVGDFPEVVHRPRPEPAKPAPLPSCPDCGASTFRTAADRDRHLLRCREPADQG